ncbi:hypothetical protein M408DRAFT_67898 [Serendipita vermifera MAFF 305830]|uniref:cyclin-dependent kinase n=1 Tax=Serendipita vermifera MAFF 305830 TaxID=933852 RepID=A0A0C2WTR5_SERVB|nr:hypothetical protein M408DRAFT_67898 [Serendipita vermifera MAFF 305830]
MPTESQQRSLPTEEQSQDLPSVTPALTEDIVQDGDEIACPYPCNDDTPSISQNLEAAESTTCSETPLNSQPLSEKGTTINSEEPFEFITLVGEGSYGTVSKARDRQNGRLVALKKIRTESQRNGFPVTALREIKILQSLHHENVVQLREMVVRKGAIFLSFEYLEHDLVGLLRQKVFELKVEHMKSFTQQLLRGLEYLHSRGILHRDLKAANLLVTRQGALKIGDFGLARSYNKRKHADYTNHVCTLLYRAPELMLGETIYGPEIDIWSAGCIFMELFLKKVLFEGRDDIDQLGLIYSTLGSPSGTYAQCLLHKPWYSLMDLTKFENCFRAKYASIISVDALDFAETLLDLDGTKRPSATSALGHPYFQSMPHAAKPDLSSLADDYHEYDERSNRKGRESQAK